MNFVYGFLIGLFIAALLGLTIYLILNIDFSCSTGDDDDK